MSATFNRPKNIRYTQMSMYIDEHMKDIAESNQNPEIEAKIFEYLYHILYALSCKAGYFKHFDDYDLFSCYGATELYISMRKKIQNAGKEVRGKIVTPVKNTLDFIKAVMYPLKVTFQRDNFLHVIDPAFCDTATLEGNMREDIQSQYRGDPSDSYLDAAKEVSGYIRDIINESPFRNDKLFCKKLYLSCVLTLIDNLTLPNKIREKLEKKAENPKMNGEKMWNKISAAYKPDVINVTRWHIDEKIDNYIRIIIRRVTQQFSKTLRYYLHQNDLSDEILDNVMRSVYETTDIEREDME